LIYKEWRLTKCQVFTTILIFVVSALFIGELSLISEASEHSLLSFSDPLSVKIIYPEKEREINIGSNLEITGTSGYNSDLTCHVAVIINDIKPYQKATPTGTNTKNDYTTWEYIVDPDYTTINRGDNKITARLLCSDDRGQDLRKWYSVNVVGQDKTENSHQSLSTTTLTVPITIGTESTVTPATINIDRDVFLELINNRIENNTEVIRDAIEDSIMSLYTRLT
jgi:hypothetical protein